MTNISIKSAHVSVKSGSLYCESAGKGTPLVMIHAGIADHRMWDAQFKAFADDYRVVRYDCRGYGRSQTQDVEFSNRDDLLAILDQLGDEPAILMGCSRGGQIAVDFTLEHPERVKALVLVGAGLGGFSGHIATPREENFFIEMEKAEADKNWDLVSELDMRLWVDGLAREPEAVDQGFRAQAKMMSRAVYDHVDEEITPIPLDPPAADRLDAINAPLIYIYGDLDASEMMAMGQAYKDKVAGAELVEMKGTAHLPSMEKPEEFNAILRGFLGKL